MKVTLESVFRQSRDLCEEVLKHVQTPQKLATLALYAVLSGAFYGATMGMNHSALQALASAAKVPILFLITLLICLPSLHFLGLLFGATIRFEQTASVLTAGLCRTSILLSAFAPISLFFLISGSDYRFLLLMHVGIFTVCGAGGLVTIFRDFAQVQARMQETSQQSNRPGEEVVLFNHNQGNFYSYVWSVWTEWIQR
jgi:spore maturation protein SpmB